MHLKQDSDIIRAGFLKRVKIKLRSRYVRSKRVAKR